VAQPVLPGSSAGRLAIIIAGISGIVICMVVLTRTEGEFTLSDGLLLAAGSVIVAAMERLYARQETLSARVEQVDRDRATGDAAVVKEVTELVANEATSRATADEALLARINEQPERCHALRTACHEASRPVKDRLVEDVSELRGEVGILVHALVPADLRPKRGEKANGFLARPFSAGSPVPTRSALARERRRARHSPAAGAGAGEETPISIE